MPRYRRIIPPGSLVHVICQFVNKEVRLKTPAERSAYLRLWARAIGQSDWRIVSYALMGTHPHLGLFSGHDPFDSWMRKVNGPFAGWLNQQQDRKGPVFAERPKTIVLPHEQLARMVVYHHNNPVKAGIVARASDSNWSSHRAYLFPRLRPPWLEARFVLEVCGFSDTAAGRRCFDNFVDRHRDDPRNPLLCGQGLDNFRRQVRLELRTAVELSYPFVDPVRRRFSCRLVSPDGVTRPSRWPGALTDIVEAVAKRTALDAETICSSSRERWVCNSRRLAALVAHRYLGRNLAEIAPRLGITPGAAGQLLRRVSADQDELARVIACELKSRGQDEESEKMEGAG